MSALAKPAADFVLRARAITLRDETHRVVEALDLEIARGESVALVGDDQLALTMVIRAIGGLEIPASGTLELLGVDVGRATRDDLLRLRRDVGYVSVGGGLFSNMTVRANVEVALRYHRVVRPGEVRARAQELIDLVGLTSVADAPASTVPAELQKCAAYVRAMATEPSVFLSEDPAAFLHPEGRAAIERLHDRLRERGTTVILADDDHELAQCLAERAVAIDHGRKVFDGSFEDLHRRGDTMPAPGGEG